VFTSNPFAALSDSISSTAIQTYVIVMIALVVGGTLFDVWHKRSAAYFFASWRNAQAKGTRRVAGGTIAGLAVRTALVEVLTSAEFGLGRRRVAHLLTMYGFLLHVATTIVMVFCYPTAATPTPAVLPQLWVAGALLVMVGGYWFWFFIRVDVAAEGHTPFRIMRADLFILSLLASATLGLIWAGLQSIESAGTNVLLGLYLVATTVLFGSVPWSKFSHMFFKPAAAFEKRVSEAAGSRSNLPAPADEPETLGSARERPSHY